MKENVQFIGLEKSAKDLIVSFAIDDSALGIRSLILLRTPVYEYILYDEERGVKVSLEGDYFEQEDFNMLKSIKKSGDEVKIKSTFREYQLYISNVKNSE